LLRMFVVLLYHDLQWTKQFPNQGRNAQKSKALKCFSLQKQLASFHCAAEYNHFGIAMRNGYEKGLFEMDLVLGIHHSTPVLTKRMLQSLLYCSELEIVLHS